MKRRIHRTEAASGRNAKGALSDFEFSQQIGRKLVEELWTWKGDGHREWDRIAIEIYLSNDFEAEVLRSGSGHHLIRISSGIPSTLRAVMIQLFDNPDFLMVRPGKKMGKSKRKASGSLPLLEVSGEGYLKEETREWLIQFITLTATRFVYYHELAHVVRGHLHHDWVIRGRSTHSEAGFNGTDPHHRRLWRLFETDADVVGSDFFARLTALESWRKLDSGNKRWLCTLCLFSAGLSLLLLDREQKRSVNKVSLNAKPIHQPPFIRFLILLDILGGAFRRELGMTFPQILRYSKTAMGFLAQASHCLQANAKLWTAVDKGGWRKSLARQTKLLSEHQMKMKALLGKRSTLLPMD